MLIFLEIVSAIIKWSKRVDWRRWQMVKENIRNKKLGIDIMFLKLIAVKTVKTESRMVVTRG